MGCTQSVDFESRVEEARARANLRNSQRMLNLTQRQAPDNLLVSTSGTEKHLHQSTEQMASQEVKVKSFSTARAEFIASIVPPLRISTKRSPTNLMRGLGTPEDNRCSKIKLPSLEEILNSESSVLDLPPARLPRPMTLDDAPQLPSSKVSADSVVSAAHSRQAPKNSLSGTGVFSAVKLVERSPGQGLNVESGWALSNSQGLVAHGTVDLGTWELDTEGPQASPQLTLAPDAKVCLDDGQLVPEFSPAQLRDDVVKQQKGSDLGGMLCMQLQVCLAPCVPSLPRGYVASHQMPEIDSKLPPITVTNETFEDLHAC